MTVEYQLHVTFQFLKSCFVMFDIYVTILIVIHFVRSTPHIVQLFMKG